MELADVKAVEVKEGEILDFLNVLSNFQKSTEGYNEERLRGLVRSGWRLFLFENAGEKIGTFAIMPKYQKKPAEKVREVLAKINPFGRPGNEGEIRCFSIAEQHRKKPALLLGAMDCMENKARGWGIKKIHIIINHDNPNWRFTWKRAGKGINGYSLSLDSLRWELFNGLYRIGHKRRKAMLGIIEKSPWKPEFLQRAEGNLRARIKWVPRKYRLLTKRL